MPGTSYMKNLLGSQLSDQQFEDIPHPTLELYTHVTIKTIQTGAIFSTLLAAPIACAIKPETRNLTAFMQKSSKFGRYGLIFGLVAGPLATYAKIRTIENLEEGLFDRDYRLRHNRNQVRVDRGSMVGAVVGAGLTVAQGQGALAGAMIGIAAGTLTMAAYNTTK